MAQNGAQEPDILAIFQGILAQDPPGTAELPALLRALEAAEAAEAALQALKRAHPRATAPKDPWHALRVRLDQAATRARERRMSRWQHDPRRRTLRLRFAQRGPAAALSPAALQAALGQALQAAGLPVAGNDRMLEAKIGGITPDMLSFSGRNDVWFMYALRPPWRRA